MGFEEFVRERQRSLFRFSVVLCGDVVLAEDLVQNVLGRAFERWSLVAAADDPNAYVRRMLVNEYISWRRRLHRSAPVAHLSDEHVPGAPDPADQHGDRDAMSAMLAKLPPRQRAVLVLRYYADLSYAEIASYLGCREASARAHASRAHAALRIQLASPLQPAEPLRRSSHA